MPNTMVHNWNVRHRIGTRVRVKLDDGSTKDTHTTSDAILLGGHTPVVWLEGFTGAYALERVIPLDASVDASAVDGALTLSPEMVTHLADVFVSGRPVGALHGPRCRECVTFRAKLEAHAAQIHQLKEG